MLSRLTFVFKACPIELPLLALSVLVARLPVFLLVCSKRFVAASYLPLLRPP
jgi:hypothetical protein